MSDRLSEQLEQLATLERAGTKVGIAVTCAVCGRQKAPHGRSVPDLKTYCESRLKGERGYCEGYRQSPDAGCLWPGETDADFGFHCCNAATKPIAALPVAGETEGG